MKVLERQVQQIHLGKWAELESLNAKYEAIESGVGFPPKKRYRHYIGGHNFHTLIIEYEWESLAAMEEAYEKVFANPEWCALEAEAASIMDSVQVELYAPLP
jgi:hypothetical protein